MSRALSVLEEFVSPSSINRGALMLDEGKVFNQWWEEEAGGGGGGSAVDTTLYDGSGSLVGTLREWHAPQPYPGTDFYIETPDGGMAPFSGGTYLVDAGAGKVFNVWLDATGKITRSGTTKLPSGPGGTGGTGGTYHPPEWRPGELELEQAGLGQSQEALDIQREELEQRRQEQAQRLEEIRLQGQQEAAAAQLDHDRAIQLLEMEMEHASEMQKERIQAEIDLENLRHENNMAQLEERIEADKKMVIYGEIGATGRTMMQEQGAMKRELLQLGPDPLGQLAGIGGQATRGVTPQQQAVGQAQAFINQPIPQASMEMSLPQLEGVLGGMPTGQPPMAGGFGMAGPIGMKHGGTVKTRKGKQQSVIVGETSPEIVTGSDFQVTPLAGTAQYGMRIGGVGTQGAQPWRPVATATGPDWADPPPQPPSWPSDWGGYPPETQPHVNPLIQPPSWPSDWGGYPPETQPHVNPLIQPSPQPTPWYDKPGAFPWMDPNFRSPRIGWRWQPGERGWKGPLPPQGWYEQIEQPYIDPILQGLARMYAGSPFGQVPVGVRAGTAAAAPRLELGGWEAPSPSITMPGTSGMSPGGAMSALGVTPQLIRPPSGNTYFIQNGMRHWIPGGGSSNVLTGLGLDPSQVVNVSHEDALRFSPAEWFTGTGAQAAGAVSGQTGYGALGSPLVEATSGALLMSPHKIAGNWGQMTDIEQQVQLSAYKHAGGPTGFGLSPQSVLDMIQTFTPAGRGYGRRIGGIGGQY